MCIFFIVNSLLEMVPAFFAIPGIKVFLTERLCQDPLEKFFGCQRQRGGTHDNPTVHEFCSNTRALRVIDSFCVGSVCRGARVEASNIEDEKKPLPKRARSN